jgi:type I restriction-modification system DNA methylase subunit
VHILNDQTLNRIRNTLFCKPIQDRFATLKRRPFPLKRNFLTMEISSARPQGSGMAHQRPSAQHALLRLPTGIFYAQGVKANVLFFDRRVAAEKPWTKKLWIYDFRTNEHFTLKTNPLRRENLDDFVTCYHAENRHKRKETERFHAFAYDDLIKRDKASLDIFWLKDDSLEDAANLPAPDVIAAEIVEDLQAALDELALIAEDLRKN